MLHQNQPNPFRKQTTISYYLPTTADATLTVYDLTGKVILIREAKLQKGWVREDLDMTRFGQSGVYMYKLETGDFSEIKKMIQIE